MQSLECLPEFEFKDCGILSRCFLERGITTFHDACRLVKSMPYEDNDLPSDDALFILGHGSCTSKHRAIAVCAAEQGVPVYQIYGIYELDESIVAGVTTILAEYGIPYVPTGHCFLAWNDTRVDLTEGNRNGKRGPLNSFLATARLTPYRPEIIARLYALCDANVLDLDPRFTHVSQTQLEEARNRCKLHMQKHR
jgi:hypothetical protein